MKSIYRTTWLSFVTATLLLSFNNCSNVSMTPIEDTSSTTGNPDPDPVVVVKKKCENSVPVSQTVTVSFPEPARNCAWNAGGNLGAKDSYFQARTEQEVEFQLPVGATICDLDFKFNRQKFYYDDHILLALNNRILATSYNWTGILSKDGNGLEVYDWSRIAGKDWETPSDKEGIFCAGKAEGKATCSWPETQEDGEISMEFDQSVIQKVMAASTTLDKHVFKFVTTGDNDEEIDCWHKSISFTVDVKYVK